MPINFCGDHAFRQAISNILASQFFGVLNPNQITAKDILNWYDKFYQNLPDKNGKQSFVLGIPFSLSYSYMGHDLPIWLEGDPFKTPITVNNSSMFKGTVLTNQSYDQTPNPSSAKHRVMIIGQDPMRPTPSQGNLQIESPWGLHYPYGYNRKHARFYNWIICPLLQKGCSIYVTDYYKLYATKKPVLQTKDNIIDSRNNVIRYRINYDDILRDEINAYKPTHIIVLGTVKTFPGSGTVNDTNYPKIRIIFANHPNWKVKKQILDKMDCHDMRHYYEKEVINKIP